MFRRSPVGQVGELCKVKRIVKLNVMVQSANGFADQPEVRHTWLCVFPTYYSTKNSRLPVSKVANGASDLFAEIFGDKGVHARTALGVNALPRGVAVEIDAIVEVDDK